MFDINEMINESFFMSPLQRAQKDGYVNITGPEGKRKIKYITLERHSENYEDPEEKVRADYVVIIAGGTRRVLDVSDKFEPLEREKKYTC